MRELSRRLELVTYAARRLQHPDVVNPRVHLVLFAVIIVLMAWPDTRFVSELVHGFPAVGHCLPCGLWQSQAAPFCTLQDALVDGVTDALDVLPHLLRAHEDSAVALAAGEEDE